MGDLESGSVGAACSCDGDSAAKPVFDGVWNTFGKVIFDGLIPKSPVVDCASIAGCEQLHAPWLLLFLC